MAMTKTRKKIVAGLIALGAFGALTASASSLGGVRSTSLGASANVVAACDTDGIDLSYGNNTYDPASNDYKSNTVTLAGVATACQGKAFRITLSNATAALNETTGVVNLTSNAQTVTLSSPVRSEDVSRSSIVITG